MTDTSHAAMDNVERLRAELEENVAKLRRALGHWSTWEHEYELLKESIQNADSPSPSEMMEIGRNLGCNLVNEKEVAELLGQRQQTKRTANQVIDMISRRIDYVQQNSLTVDKQLEAAEKKLAGASVLSEPDLENEEGLPLMDVHEELDDDDNMISGKLVQPGKAAPEIVEALRRAGVQKADLDRAAESNKPPVEPSVSSTPQPQKTGQQSTSKDLSSTTITDTADEPRKNPPQQAPQKKSVTFADDTKSEPLTTGPEPSSPQLSSFEATGYNEALADFNWTRGTKVIEVDENDEKIASYPIVPQDDTPEAAELRRQMLQYGLAEVGQIVAEMDLDEPDNDYSDEEMDGDYTEGSEDEDTFGRSTRRVVDDEYRQRMMELEKSLNARMLENVGPNTQAQKEDDHPLAAYSNDVRRLVVRKDEEVDEAIASVQNPSVGMPSQKKGARFADDLDVAPPTQGKRDQTPASQVVSKPTSTTTISDTIIERNTQPPQPPATTASKPAKVSRFKSSRSSSTPTTINMLPPRAAPEPQPVPQGPSGRPLASTIVEHSAETSNPEPPDEFDPAIINREVQVQYHKMRNRMIQQQGGFKPAEGAENDVLMEEKDGKTKRVSRFRAARLNADGL